MHFRELIVSIDGSDDNYMPQRIVVKGGDENCMKQLNDVSIDQ